MELACALCRSRISAEAIDIQNGGPDKGLKGVQKIFKISSDLLFVPKDNINIGTRVVAEGAPTLWNMLCCTFKSVENIVKCHRYLKTFIYNLAYPAELPGVSNNLMTTGIIYPL